MFEYLEKRKIWMVYFPLILYWLILVIATSIPLDTLPSVGFTDKVNHFIAYLVLSVLVNLTLIFQRKSKFIFDTASVSTIIICLFYGIMDELHQKFIPGRSAEIMDWIADACGVVTGVLVIYLLKILLKYQLDFK